MELQRQQPSFARLRWAIQQKLPMADIYAEYPCVSRDVVASMHEDLLDAATLDIFAREVTCELRSARTSVSGKHAARAAETTEAPEDITLTDAARRLKAENLQRGLDDLTRPHAVLSKVKQRRTESLLSQRVEGGALDGLQAAERRGLALLVAEYQELLLKYFKEQARARQVDRGEALPAGADADLEYRYERLPLSPILVGPDGCLEGKSMKALAGATEDAAALRQILLIQVREHAESVLEAGAAGEDSCVALSQHQEILGAIYAYLDGKGVLAAAAATRKRLRGKTGVTKATDETFRLLLTFALSAWVGQTERWYRMPDAPTRNMPMVCNLTNYGVRALGSLVQDEMKYSSRPMFEHLCAACGRLLYSRTEHAHLPRELGVCGSACQTRGAVTTWHAMPAFLLLWSKERLGCYLRAVCHYDVESKALTLRNGWESAPWLHFQPNTRRIDEAAPWYYCTDCHDYFVPTVKDPKDHVLRPKSMVRVPMRNRQEALFTRWHLDIGFVHMREKLLVVFPNLRGQLPSADEVMHFRSVYNQWVQVLKEKDPMQAANTHPAALGLRAQLDDMEARWCPAAHTRADLDYSPIPVRLFAAAAGAADVRAWDLRRCHTMDLVPHEQADLMQDMPEVPELRAIASCEARACISLCRPEGRYVSRRKLPGRAASVVPTQPFHSGEYSIRALTPHEDEARGFITGIVATEKHLEAKFRIKPGEAAALQTVLPALRERNPWHEAYCSSLRDVQTMKEFVQQLHAEGCIAPRVPGALTDDSGNPISHALGDEQAAILVPAEALDAGGSYEQLRICADTI